MDVHTSYLYAGRARTVAMQMANPWPVDGQSTVNYRRIVAKSNLDLATVLKGCRNASSINECIYG
jgi:hypothetical protein